MPQIIFEKTDRQKVAAQGESYSHQPGYHIWTRENNEDSEMIFIGYVPNEKFDNIIAYYNAQGNHELFLMKDTGE